MTETKAIRAGVIGFGNAGRNFHSAVVDAVPGLELATIVQRSGDAAAQAFPHVKFSRSVEEMLRDETIRLVVVATPNVSHFSLAAQALEADRDVVIDKPFAEHGRCSEVDRTCPQEEEADFALSESSVGRRFSNREKAVGRREAGPAG